MKKNPLQPIIKDEHGTLRFKKNEIVDYLLENGGIDLNEIARMPFNNDDREQFASLIGYSLGGFSELGYVSDEAYESAIKMSEGMTETEARNKVLSKQIEDIRKGLKEIVPIVSKIIQNDLEV